MLLILKYLLNKIKYFLKLFYIYLKLYKKFKCAFLINKFKFIKYELKMCNFYNYIFFFNNFFFIRRFSKKNIIFKIRIYIIKYINIEILELTCYVFLFVKKIIKYINNYSNKVKEKKNNILNFKIKTNNKIKKKLIVIKKKIKKSYIRISKKYRSDTDWAEELILLKRISNFFKKIKKEIIKKDKKIEYEDKYFLLKYQTYKDYKINITNKINLDYCKDYKDPVYFYDKRKNKKNIEDYVEFNLWSLNLFKYFKIKHYINFQSYWYPRLKELNLFKNFIFNIKYFEENSKNYNFSWNSLKKFFFNYLGPTIVFGQKRTDSDHIFRYDSSWVFLNDYNENTLEVNVHFLYKYKFEKHINILIEIFNVYLKLKDKFFFNKFTNNVKKKKHFLFLKRLINVGILNVYYIKQDTNKVDMKETYVNLSHEFSIMLFYFFFYLNMFLYAIGFYFIFKNGFFLAFHTFYFRPIRVETFEFVEFITNHNQIKDEFASIFAESLKNNIISINEMYINEKLIPSMISLNSIHNFTDVYGMTNSWCIALNELLKESHLSFRFDESKCNFFKFKSRFSWVLTDTDTKLLESVCPEVKHRLLNYEFFYKDQLDWVSIIKNTNSLDLKKDYFKSLFFLNFNSSYYIYLGLF